MSEKDAPDLLNRPAGAVALTKYRAHGGGAELFRAYMARRNADREANQAHKAEVITAMTPDAGCGVPVDVWERARSELVMIQILEELDPVIEDLLRVCKGKKEGKERLVELHSALRIGKHHATNDSFNTERRWEIEQCWIAAYGHMQTTRQYLSENAIAKQIAESMSVTSRTALSHWKAKKKREPQQEAWAKQIEERAQLHTALERRRVEETKGAKKAKTVKPKKSNYRKQNL